jgi:hypothetical protein
MNIHDLTNTARYSSFHKYHASAAINIFSPSIIRKGDLVIINKVLYTLGTNKNVKGTPHETANDKGWYYEFTIQKFKKS